MSEPLSPTPWSTVAALPDCLLLAQTRQLARHEQALQILVLDHLREIEARCLHLTRGYGSLFDYVVHELDYTAAAAWRRIKAMRLCTGTGGARELLQDGKLNLSNAAQLQNLFERSDRSHGRPPGSDGAGGSLGGAPRSGEAPGEPASAVPTRAEKRDPAEPAAGPVLDAAAREELVRQAAGKSTREVQQMLAEVDPELAQPRDWMRALGGGRWELKAAVDAECRHGLEKLQMLLSHRDPHLTLGGLVARLVRDGLDRYDPARPPRARRPGGRGSVERAQSASQPARRNTEGGQRSVVRANGSDVERPREGERDDASVAADRGRLPGASAANRHAQTACDSTRSTPVPDDSGRTQSAANRITEAERGNASAAAAANGGYTASAAKRRSKPEHGGASPAAAPNSGKHTTSAPRRKFQAELGRPSRAAARDGSGRVATAANRPSETELGGASPTAAPNSGGYTASTATRRSKAELGSASPTAAPNSDGHAASTATRPAETEHGGASPTAAPNSGGHAASTATRRSKAKLGGASLLAAPNSDGHAASTATRPAETEHGSASLLAAPNSGGHATSTATRPAETEHGSASLLAAPNSGGYTASTAKCRSKAELGGASLLAAPNSDGHAALPVKRPSGAEHGSAPPNSGGRPTSPEECQSEAGLGRAERAAAGDGSGLAVAAPKRDTEAGRGGAKYSPAADVGGRAGSAAKRRGQAGGAGRDARAGGGLDRMMAAAGARSEADRRGAARAPRRCGTRVPTSPAMRLAYAAGHGSGRPAQRSPALERHLAALRCVGAVPSSRSRYIPVAVRREVWRRDQGCCSYVDPHSGRRCGSRYRLEIDHIVPFALGGGAEPRNLTLHCRAHHRLRHAHRHVHAESVPTEARRAPVFAANRGRALIRRFPV